MDRALSQCQGGLGSNPAYSSLLYFSDFEEQLAINREKSIFNREVRKRDRKKRRIRKWKEMFAKRGRDDVIRTKTEDEHIMIVLLHC